MNGFTSLTINGENDDHDKDDDVHCDYDDEEDDDDTNVGGKKIEEIEDDDCENFLIIILIYFFAESSTPQPDRDGQISRASVVLPRASWLALIAAVYYGLHSNT